MAPRKKKLDEWQDGGTTDPNIADGGSANEPDERTVIMVFDGVGVVEQFVTLTGANAMKLPEKLNHGDEVVFEVSGKVQKGEIITRNKERRDGGRDETVINRKVKVDGIKLIRATSQML